MQALIVVGPRQQSHIETVVQYPHKCLSQLSYGEGGKHHCLCSLTAQLKGSSRCYEGGQQLVLHVLKGTWKPCKQSTKHQVYSSILVMAYNSAAQFWPQANQQTCFLPSGWHISSHLPAKDCEDTIYHLSQITD